MVLLPYEITLFSNGLNINMYVIEVLLPYEITLFSNYIFLLVTYIDSFTTL